MNEVPKRFILCYSKIHLFSILFLPIVIEFGKTPGRLCGWLFNCLTLVAYELVGQIKDIQQNGGGTP